MKRPAVRRLRFLEYFTIFIYITLRNRVKILHFKAENRPFTLLRLDHGDTPIGLPAMPANRSAAAWNGKSFEVTGAGGTAFGEEGFSPNPTASGAGRS